MKDFKTELGFTLIEMAFVILIMGLIVGSVFSFYTPQLQAKQIQETIDKQNKIARALSDYAQRTGRLPCPSPVAPYTSMGTGPATCNAAGSPATRDGIVPYRDLGLTQEDATDGYGNPFTYNLNAANGVATGANGHRNCRINTVWVSGGANYNINKAYLCCLQSSPFNAYQLEIYSNTAKTLHVTSTQEDIIPTAGHFGSLTTTGVQTVATLTYFSYALISHGKNGEGAYMFSQPLPAAASTGRRAFNSPYFSDTENANNDRDFVVLPYSLAADNPGASTYYFDDIILWRTQEAMVRETGNNSCSRP